MKRRLSLLFNLLVNPKWLDFLNSESRCNYRDGMLFSKLEHVGNVFIAPVRNKLEHPLFYQQGWTWEKSEVVHIQEVNYVNEDTWHGSVQATECGWYLWDWRSIGEVSIIQSTLGIVCSSRCLIVALENDPPHFVGVWFSSPVHTPWRTDHHVYIDMQAETVGLCLNLLQLKARGKVSKVNTH